MAKPKTAKDIDGYISQFPADVRAILRKEGNQIFYRLRDPLLGEVLEAMRKFFLSHIREALVMLKKEKHEAEKNKSGQEAGR